ncbi:MAG: sodium:proton antiporter [Rhizobiaceae bacterium]|nr:sodium:proton antiporter [Rhizobiaceae bacterium]
MLTVLDLATLLLTLSALFGWMNQRWLRLPHTIGLLMIGLGSSIVLLLLHSIFPTLGITTLLQDAIAQIDFYNTIMNGFLAFLLFAGALHVNFAKLADQKWAIGFLATFGVLISTAIVGFGMWWVSRLLGSEVPLVWALVFGALISPTDPVAVLSLLKTVNVPEALKTRIAGESLFNDGVAVVAFSVLVGVAVGASAETPHLDVRHVAELFFYEGVGGILFGALTGYIAFRLMASIDDHVVEILISIALAMLTYAISVRLHVSGPIAVVVAGLIIGNQGKELAMSEKVREHMFSFWEVVDELLNSVLFLLIGLEVLVLAFDLSHLWLALASIPLALAARFISVSSPRFIRSLRPTFGRGSVAVMTWGGLRGGVSVALALSLPPSDYKDEILAVTYAVVIFTIVVQGLTVKRVIDRTIDPKLL